MDTKQKYNGCSAIIYRKEDSKIFIAQRKLNKSFGAGLWETIGGGLENYDKDCIDCIKREIEEELHTDTDSVNEFQDYSIANKKGNTFLIKTFIVTLKSKPIPKPRAENSKVLKRYPRKEPVYL